MTAPLRIVGTYLSPYVRKVLAVLHLKGLAYEIDPIIPFFGGDAFTALSPLRRIPVLVDGDVTLPDSTVICEYLEDRYPAPSVYPRDAAARARARWLEEYADTRLGEVFIWRFFNEVVIKRFVWGTEPDAARLEKTMTEEIPDVLGYLERLLPRDGFLFGDPSVADVAVAAFFRNAAFARFEVDAARWPVTAAFVARAFALDAFHRLAPFEDACRRTPIPRHREALAALGAPLTASSVGTATPQRGPMTV